MYKPTAQTKNKLILIITAPYNSLFPPDFPMRMTRRRALEYSIAKWSIVVEELEKPEPSSSIINFAITPKTCGLCEKYFRFGCKGCPIFEKTKRACCHRTPYDAFLYVKKKATRLKYAKAELQFLQDLHTELYGGEG